VISSTTTPGVTTAALIASGGGTLYGATGQPQQAGAAGSAATRIGVSA
jgi:hypothetical protein